MAVLLLRIHRLPQPTTIPLLLHYAGCRSWVELEAELPRNGLSPVPSDAAFWARAEEIRGILTRTP